MDSKIIFAFVLLSSLLLFSNTVFADIYVRPAKLGIIRLTTQPLFPTIYQGTFDVGNTYNFSLNVTLSPSQNISSMVSLSDANLMLQPNVTKTVSFTIKPTEPGVYQGSVIIAFSTVDSKINIAYQDDITIIVSQSNSYVLVLAALVVVAVIVVCSIFVMTKKKVRGKK